MAAAQAKSVAKPTADLKTAEYVIRESHGGTDLAATTTRTLCSAYKRQHRSRMVGKLP